MASGLEEVNRVIGANDLVLVKDDLSNIPKRFQKYMTAIGKLSSGCTVNYIGQEIALTAGHCFWQTFFDENMKLNESCSEDVISWQMTASPLVQHQSKCLEIIAMQRSEALGVDFAIIKVDNPPPVALEVDWNFVLNKFSFLTIFSYPEDQPLSWSRYCRSNNETSQKNPYPDQLHHLCDTKTGSSGAAVLNATNAKVIALHRSGDGDFLSDGSMTEAVENYAVYISKMPIKSILEKRGFFSKYKDGFPDLWWKPVPKEQLASWEIGPQEADRSKGEVILSKRNELGQFSNLSSNTFVLDGVKYNSLEGLWQGMKYPENPQDERFKNAKVVWPYTREQVYAMDGFAAKDAGDIANKNMKELGISWITYQGKKIEYKTTGKAEHYDIIYKASVAKIEQNPDLKKLLLSTGNLKFLPDHAQQPGAAPAYLYFDIYMKIRDDLRKSP